MRESPAPKRSAWARVLDKFGYLAVALFAFLLIGVPLLLIIFILL